MTFTEGEFDTFRGLLQTSGPGELTDEDAAAYRVALEPFEPQECVSALFAVGDRKGGAFRPSWQEIRHEALQGRSPRETFGTVWTPIERALGQTPWSYSDSGPIFDDEWLIGQVRDEVGEKAAAWLAAYGTVRLHQEQLNDPEFRGAILHRLQRDYDEFTSDPALVERAVARLDAPAHSGAGMLRQMDPLAALGVGGEPIDDPFAPLPSAEEETPEERSQRIAELAEAEIAALTSGELHLAPSPDEGAMAPDAAFRAAMNRMMADAHAADTRRRRAYEQASAEGRLARPRPQR